MDDPEGFICFNADEALDILREFVTSAASTTRCRIVFVGHSIDPDDAEVSGAVWSDAAWGLSAVALTLMTPR